MLCFMTHQQEVSQRIDVRYFQIEDYLLIYDLVLRSVCVSAEQCSWLSEDASFPVQRVARF